MRKCQEPTNPDHQSRDPKLTKMVNKSWFKLKIDSITKDSNYERVDLRGLNERDVEIEHLKTTVIALSEKVEVSNISDHNLNYIMRYSYLTTI